MGALMPDSELETLDWGRGLTAIVPIEGRSDELECIGVKARLGHLGQTGMSVARLELAGFPNARIELTIPSDTTTYPPKEYHALIESAGWIVSDLLVALLAEAEATGEPVAGYEMQCPCSQEHVADDDNPWIEAIRGAQQEG